MKKTIIISVLTLSAILSCTPVDRPDDMVPPEIPGQNGGENGVENYTPEISTDENGYDGLTATDKEADTVIAGDETYWENQEFLTTVTVTYSDNSAVVTSAGNAVKHYITGADVAIDLTDAGAAEIIASGKSDDGQLKIYGNSAVKLTLNGLELTSAKSAAINVQNKSRLYLHLSDGTTNSVCDAESQSDNDRRSKQWTWRRSGKRRAWQWRLGAGMVELSASDFHTNSSILATTVTQFCPNTSQYSLPCPKCATCYENELVFTYVESLIA